MKPAELDIDITRGDFFSLFFRVRKKLPDGTSGDYEDLTDWTGLAQIRATYDAPTPLATFTVTFADQVTYKGGVLLSLADTVTSTLDYTEELPSKVIGLWDVQLTNTLGEPSTYLAGDVTLWKDVSKV